MDINNSEIIRFPLKREDISSIWSSLNCKVIPVQYLVHTLGIFDTRTIMEMLATQLGLKRIEEATLGNTRFLIAEQDSCKDVIINLMNLFLNEKLIYDKMSTGEVKASTLEGWHAIITSYDESISIQDLELFFKHMERVRLSFRTPDIDGDIYTAPVLAIAEDDALITFHHREEGMGATQILATRKETKAQEPLYDDIFLREVEKVYGDTNPQNIFMYMKSARDRIAAMMIMLNERQSSVWVKKFQPDAFFEDDDLVTGTFFMLCGFIKQIFKGRSSRAVKVSLDDGSECSIVEGLYVTLMLLFDGPVPEYIHEKVKSRFIPEFEGKYFWEIIRQQNTEAPVDTRPFRDFSDYLYDLFLPY